MDTQARFREIYREKAMMNGGFSIGGVRRRRPVRTVRGRGITIGGARRRKPVRTCVHRSARGPSGLKRCVRYRTTRGRGVAVGGARRPRRCLIHYGPVRHRRCHVYQPPGYKKYRGRGIYDMGGAKRKKSGWVEYVKALAKANGVSYFCALCGTKDPQIKQDYYNSSYYKGPKQLPYIGLPQLQPTALPNLL